LAGLLDGQPAPGPGPGAGEDALAGYLDTARELLTARPVSAADWAGPAWLPPELERLRDFSLPPLPA
jgi:hypothetical protein